MNRICTRCGVEKPLDTENYQISKGYFLRKCNDCIKELHKIYGKNNRKKLNERLKKWRQNLPEGYYKEYYKEHREKCINNSRNYVKNNREKVLENNHKSYYKNKEKCLKVSREWKLKNKEQYQKKHREWMKKNALWVKLYNQSRRALKYKATIQYFSSEDFDLRMSVFGNKCYYCGGNFEQIDHAIPLSKGGKHCLSNLRPACKTCNMRKHNKNFKDWLREINE